jgi:hypothetical protein
MYSFVKYILSINFNKKSSYSWKIKCFRFKLNVLATSQSLSTLEAISILKKGVLIKEKMIVATTIRFFQMYRYIDYGLLQM